MIERSLAQPRTSDTEETPQPHACMDGWVYIGVTVEEDGEEIEVVEAIRCRRCSAGG